MTIFITSSIPSLDNISVVVPGPKIFTSICASAADAAANPNGIKTFLSNGLKAIHLSKQDQDVYQDSLLIVSS